MPLFFGYHLDVIETFKKMGYEVTHFDERPSNNIFVKAMLRINHNFLFFVRHRHYNKVLKEIKRNHYDYVIVFDGQTSSKSFLKSIKKQSPKTKMILYLWDSLHYYPYLTKIFPCFDKVFSFDFKDCYEHNLEYMPTFFRDSYNPLEESDENHKYYGSFIGTMRPGKYKTVTDMIAFLEENGKGNNFIYRYLPSKIIFRLYKLFDKRFKKAKESDFVFSPINNNEVIEVFRKSDVVIDVTAEHQCGITVRCYEALAMKKKVITNNQYATKLNKYGENVLLFPCSKKEFEAFANRDFIINDSFYKDFSIETFCSKLIKEFNY